MGYSVRLAEVELPAFGLPSVEPTIPADIYHQRIQSAQRLWAARQLNVVVVYADREHASNMAYLTGYDARFEEALLVFDLRSGDGKPTLVVGNEGWAYAAASPIPLTKLLYQNFSLPGQPRGSGESLTTIFHSVGVDAGSTVGVVGWKSYTDRDAGGTATWLDIPAYIADTLRDMVGAAG